MKREKGPKCQNCLKPVEIGQVILPWEDSGEMHANCEDPFSLKVKTSANEPVPMILLDRPMVHIPLEIVTNHNSDINKKMLDAAVETLSSFSEGVVWSVEQIESYKELATAVKSAQHSVVAADTKCLLSPNGRHLEDNTFTKECVFCSKALT